VVGCAGGLSVPFYKGRVQTDRLARPLWALFLTRSLIRSQCAKVPYTNNFHCKTRLRYKATVGSLHTLLCSRMLLLWKHTIYSPNIVCDRLGRTHSTPYKSCVKELSCMVFCDTIISICLGCYVSIIEIICCHIVQLQEQSIIFGHWLIYSALQKIMVLLTKIRLGVHIHRNK
jgi:hypothetical protein